MPASERIALVTGATSGLGLETARALARGGMAVVVHGRTPERCEAAVAEVRRTVPDARVEWVAGDLAAQAQVRALAAEVRRRHDRLHVLVNNAGAVFQSRRRSPDGIELTLAVNHLAPFLLTAELLGALRAGAPARVVAVSSVAHEGALIDFDDLQLERGYRPFAAYARSKLANLLFTYELDRRAAGTGVRANAVHPGLVRTAIGAKGGRLTGLGWWLVQRRHRRLAVGPQDGARAIVDVAAAPELEGVGGAYFAGGRRAVSSPASRDPEAAARLWAASEALTGAVSVP